MGDRLGLGLGVQEGPDPAQVLGGTLWQLQGEVVGQLPVGCDLVGQVPGRI